MQKKTEGPGPAPNSTKETPQAARGRMIDDLRKRLETEADESPQTSSARMTAALRQRLETEADAKRQVALVTEREAAAILGIAPRTLSIWRSTKRYALPFVKVGRAVRYRRDALEAFILARTVAGGGQ